MTRRIENGYFALVIFCVIALITIAYVSYTFAFFKGRQIAEKEHADHYSQLNSFESKYTDCLENASSLFGFRSCIDGAEIVDREMELAEQDIIIQKEMANWAEAMFWAAWLIGVATLGATIVGVRYVYLTLVATQSMATDTQRIGEAQARAYLSVTKVYVGRDAANSSLAFACEVSNFGLSPAIDAYALVKVRFFAMDTVFDFLIVHEFGAIRQGENPPNIIHYSDRKLSHDVFEGIQASHIQVLLKAKDVFGRNIQCSGFFMGGVPQYQGSMFEIHSALDAFALVGGGIDEREFAEVMPVWRRR